MKNDKSQAIKLMNEYKDIDIEKTKVLEVIEKFKSEHAEIFDTLESLEYEVELLNEKQNNLIPIIKDNMSSENLKKEEIGRFRFTYVAPTIKRNFNLKKFLENFSPRTKMYKDYVTESSVSDYIKVKELVYKTNNDEHEEDDE